MKNDSLSAVPLRKVRDALLAQINNAIGGLQRNKDSDEPVHTIRQELKRARATLRLLRPSIGSNAYHRENSVIRDAARPLTPVRDAKALLATLTQLHRKHDGETLEALRRQMRRLLQREHQQSQKALRRSGMAAAADTLRDAKSRIERMADPLPDRLELSGGVGRVYKNGRKSFRRARRDPSDANLHEWRKQVKYLLYQIDVARGLGARHLGKSRKLANRLGDVLGIDHDMAVFSDRVRKFGDRGSLRAGTTTIKKWRRRIKKCRSALQKKALPLGRKLYSVRVSQFKTSLKMRKAKSGASRSSRARNLHSVARM